MTDYCVDTLSVVIRPPTEPIFSERATTVSLEDEAGGLFIKIEQHRDSKEGVITVDVTEWPYIREAVEQMLRNIKQMEENGYEA